jgi:hypothetical protein
MSHAELLYPPDQPPLVPGICIDDQIGSVIQKIAQESDVVRAWHELANRPGAATVALPQPPEMKSGHDTRRRPR